MDDNTTRAAIAATGTVFWSFVFQLIERKLAEARDKHGCGLPERIGRWLGRCWARARRRDQRSLNG